MWTQAIWATLAPKRYAKSLTKCPLLKYSHVTLKYSKVKHFNAKSGSIEYFSCFLKAWVDCIDRANNWIP